MASRKIMLSEAAEFCKRSSDEEDIADDDGVFAENNKDVVVDYTMFGNPDDMFSENENEDLTSEEEQSDMMTMMWTMEIKMSMINDNFILENKNKWFVVFTLLLIKTITNLLTCLKLRKKR